MVRKLLLSLIAVLGMGMLLASAQNRQVSGTVVDQSGSPVVGATVMVEGTTVGTTTGLDGSFTLSLPSSVPQPELQVSFQICIFLYRIYHYFAFQTVSTRMYSFVYPTLYAFTSVIYSSSI